MAAKKREDAVRVRLAPGGLELMPSMERLPLVAGAMHYWRHHPSGWAPCLDAMKAMGLRVVDVYIPWGIHETDRKRFDFGERDPRLDLHRFLGMVKARGLYAVARPGPHINAELTYFGLPERVVWDRACQARTPRDNPVMLPMVPVGFPVPSYASEPFHEEVEEWFAACGPILAQNLYPEGPIVLVQIDNEGALYFRDGAYDHQPGRNLVLAGAFQAQHRAFALQAQLARRAQALGGGGQRGLGLVDWHRGDGAQRAGLDRLGLHLLELTL